VIGGQFSAIKERLKLSEVMVYYGLYPGRGGKYLCPFHNEKTPSLSIKGQYWRCFGCDCGGDVIDFLVKLYNLSPLEAARQLDSDFQLEVFQNEPPSAVQRQQVAAAARQRRYDKFLVESFEIWLDRALETVFWWLHYFDSIKVLYVPQKIDSEFTEEFSFALRKLPFLEYCWFVLARGNQEGELLEKVYFYNNYRYEVDEFERRRKSCLFEERVG
jgi:hypothetical protein